MTGNGETLENLAYSKYRRGKADTLAFVYRMLSFTDAKSGNHASKTIPLKLSGKRTDYGSENL